MKLFEKIQQYHFQLKHVIVLFTILLIFQLAVSFVHKLSLRDFLVRTQDWYQRDSAEKLANLTATSLELLLETTLQNPDMAAEEQRKMIQAFNIILSQQILQQHVEDLCVLVRNGADIFAIDNGQDLFDFLVLHRMPEGALSPRHQEVVKMYQQYQESLRAQEQIFTRLEGRQTFHVFVPFVPRGEYMGAVYMKNTPDFSFITNEIITSYNQTSLMFVALIVFGLLAMFYISSYTLRERDDAQTQLLETREKQVAELVHYQKEALFTKRIYHTHHKAEKVMGFIKEDLRSLDREHIDEIKYRVTKYANFISRVIYDMKWYDPPLQTIRNPIFKTDLNEVIAFLINHIFRRVATENTLIRYVMDLDEKTPVVPVNEFVIWEIIEPLIQNSVDHGGDGPLTVTVSTRYAPGTGRIELGVRDDGRGIAAELLQPDESGVKRIFLEHTSTKTDSQNNGYGCYIAHEFAVQRCGWGIDVENLQQGGCQFLITIPVTVSR